MAKRLAPPCRCGPEHWRGSHSKGRCWEGSVLVARDSVEWQEKGWQVEATNRPEVLLVFPCPCTRYRPAPSATRTSKRRIVTFSKEAERWVADMLDGVRLPAIGDRSRPDVVCYGADGHELLFIEVKHHPLAKFIEASVAQAEHAAKGRPAPGPLAVAVHVDKRGTGHEREGFAILRLRTLAALLKRLEGDG